MLLRAKASPAPPPELCAVPLTELDPKFHQDIIDQDGGVAESRASYFFDQDLYDMILAAPEAEQPRPIERAPATPTRRGAAGTSSTGSRLQRS